jgi:hypothetical protein
MRNLAVKVCNREQKYRSPAQLQENPQVARHSRIIYARKIEVSVSTGPTGIGRIRWTTVAHYWQWTETGIFEQHFSSNATLFDHPSNRHSNSFPFVFTTFRSFPPVSMFGMRVALCTAFARKTERSNRKSEQKQIDGGAKEGTNNPRRKLSLNRETAIRQR